MDKEPSMYALKPVFPRLIESRDCKCLSTIVAPKEQGKTNRKSDAFVTTKRKCFGTE